MAAVATSVAAIAIESLYRAAFVQQEQALLDIAQSQANLIEAIADSHRRRLPQATDAQVREATFEQVVGSRSDFYGLGKTGAVIMAGWMGDELDRLVLLHPEQDRDVPSRKMVKLSFLGEPMRLALLGESGVTKARDFRGKEVLAAHTFLVNLDYGLVAKLDLAEVRRPLLVAAAQTATVAVAMILLSAGIFFRVSGPMLHRIEASEKRLRGIVSNAVEGILTLDSQGRVVEFNRSAERIFGYRAREIQGKKLLLLIPQAHWDAWFRETFLSGAASVVGGRVELTGRRRDGEEFPLQLAISELRVGDERLFTAIVHDITLRREAEQTLRSANERLERRVAERTEALQRSNHLLAAIGQVQNIFIEAEELRPTLDGMLHHLIVLTGSRVAAIAQLEPSEGDVRVTSSQVHGVAEAEASSTSVNNALSDLYRLTDESGQVAINTSDPQVPAPFRDLGCLTVIPLHYSGAPIGLAVFGGTGQPCDPGMIEQIQPFLRMGASLIGIAALAAQKRDAENRALASQRELSGILLNIQDAIFRMDSDGRMLWLSPSVSALCGYAPEEVIGHHLLEYLLDPKDFARLKRTLAGGDGKIRDFVLGLKRKDGTETWVSANCQYFHTGTGDVGIEGVLHDINSYRDATNRIEELNSLYSLLSAANKAMVRVSNREALFQEICRIVVEIGRFRMAWIGIVDREQQRIDPVSAAGHVAGYLDLLGIKLDGSDRGRGPTAAAISTGKVSLCSDIASDASMLPWRDAALLRGYRSSAVFPFREQGVVVGAINVYAANPGYFSAEKIEVLRDLASDVSYALDNLKQMDDKRHAMDAARGFAEKLWLHVEKTPLAVVEFDLDYRIQLWNPAAEHIFGYRASEAMGRHANLIIPQHEQAPVHANVAKFRDQSDGWRNVNENMTKDGRTIICEWYNTPLTGEDGRVLGVMSLAHDITELMASRNEILALNAELEQRVIERTRQLEAVNQELEAFSYSVSHDLRAPLRSIDGFSQLLLKRYTMTLDTAGQDYLSRVRNASQRMGQLIDDLLNLSRVMRIEITRESFNLSGLAWEVIAELRQAEPERTVEFRIAADLWVVADPRLTRIALTNLLGNAWKFTSRTAQPRIVVEADNGNNETVFVVRDNGAGFDMAYAGKLFGAFQRLHSSEEFEGTGIGLATVQRIARRHGGRVWAAAEVNQGASFYFTLSSSETSISE